jgi:hypothetical protein
MESTMWNKREVVVAVTCLAVASVGQLVQLVITPVTEGESAAAKNVAKAVAHPTAMQAAAWLDLTILFFLPALAVVAYLAKARTTRIGWVGSVIAIGTTLPGIAYALAPDVLYVGAIHGHVTAGSIDAYNNSGVVELATVIFLIGHVVGLVLLAIALWRAGSVPRWAAICLAVYPVLEIAGGGSSDLRAVGVVAYLLLIAGFGACARALVGSSRLAGMSPSVELTRS